MKNQPIGFDEEKYVEMQTKKILDRVASFQNKLFIEFGGKLFDDYHASRVLPGFQPDTKIKILNQLKDRMEIIFCVSAEDIENRRIRGDSGLTYDLEALRLMSELRRNGFEINNVVVTLYKGQERAKKFAEFLEKEKDERVFLFPFMEKYGSKDTEAIISDECLGLAPFIETNKDIVLINAPGARSGKLGVALSQVYNSMKRGLPVGYAKYETFPVFDLPPDHLVNLAFKAATADFDDKIMEDDFHKKAHGVSATSYNRDMDMFPVVQELTTYSSPTEMGFNSVGACIFNSEVINQAAANEIMRRYYRYLSEYEKGESPLIVAERVEQIMRDAGIEISGRESVPEVFEIDLTSKSAKETEEQYGSILEDYYKWK